MRKKKRFVAILLSLLMVFSLCTNAIYAEDDPDYTDSDIVETVDDNSNDEIVDVTDDTDVIVSNENDTIEDETTTTNLITSTVNSESTSISVSDEVQALIDALPVVDELSSLSDDELNEVYTNLQDANNAYEALSSDEQALVDDSKLDELFDYFNSLTMVTAEEEESNVTEVRTLIELKAAINNASSGDTIRLTDDINVDNLFTSQIGNYMSIKVGLTIDFDQHEMNLNNSTYTSGTNKLFAISTDETVTFKNGKISGSETEHYYVIYGASNSTIKDLVMENFTIENFGTNTKDANSDACVYISGGLKLDGCTFQNNLRRAFHVRAYKSNVAYTGDVVILNTNILYNQASSEVSYGGGFYIYRANNVTIENCQIIKNSVNGTTATSSGGGGFAISIVYGSIKINNNSINSNTSFNGPGGGFYITGANSSIEITDNEINYNISAGYGGGIYVNNNVTSLGKVAINNNTVSENSVNLLTIINNTLIKDAEGETSKSYSKGGGIAFYDRATTHTETSAYDLSGNTITKNKVESIYGRGGGLSLYGGDASREFLITSGTITGNEAASGGGIDYTYHCASILHLYNAIITKNTAGRGGGLWSCPSSTTTMHVTLGGTIYGNTGNDMADSIRFEGTDSDFTTGSGGVFATVAARALGGTLMDWYSDEEGARYTQGDSTVDLADYTNRTTSFSLYGDLSDDGIALAQAASALLIANNTATSVGGGIASNSGVVFGNDGEVSVTVNKNWVTSNGDVIDSDSNLLPEFVTVQLVRVDDEGSEVNLESVKLNAENGWSYTFEELPTNYTYKVVETSEGDYTSTYSDVIEGEDGNYSVTITNTVETVNIAGIKTWDDAGNQDGKRPDSITVRLLANGKEVSSQTVTADDNWSYTFTNLAKYSNGEEIEYVVTEDAVENYSTTYDGYNITNSYTPEQTSVTVVKAWDDTNDKDGIRPESITVKLLKNGEDTGQTLTLSEENNWISSFTNLDVYSNGVAIEYSVEEVSVDGYTSRITGNATEAFVITNTHTPIETTTTPTNPTTPTKTTETVETNVQTNDNTNIVLYAFILVIAMAGIVTIRKTYKKKQ
ncbi:MAG: Cna B-type domain-containing protein [Erysipelotrichaceae bacterium]|nr:Cna B-type domain-containing protein [Erysipelotrichaceae bacterium]